VILCSSLLPKKRKIRYSKLEDQKGEVAVVIALMLSLKGIAMLSSVLNSERAVKVNIAIMRAFVKLREMLDKNRELAEKFSDLEQRVGKHDEEITAILEAIRQLMAPPEKPRREIGFHVREKAPRYRARKRA